MICLRFTFPHGRYHATPWGRHVNEGAVAWPPEPYRILRALIATWHRKADRETHPYEQLSELVDRLSEADPVFQLPEAVHAHTRHYMPQKRGSSDTKLVLDAFLRIEARDALTAAWDIELGDGPFALFDHLASQMHYLGRAESIVIAEAHRETPGAFAPNAAPRGLGVRPSGLDPIDLLAPIRATAWAKEGQNLLMLNTDKPKSQSRKAFEKTIPEPLVEALSVDTGDIQAAKWNAPPAGRLVLYDRPPLSPTPRRTARRPRAEPARPTVARFVLAGKPRPHVFETIRIAETMRLAAMSKWGWAETGGKKAPKAPAIISGRDDCGKPLRDEEHSHAFWLPEDADRDGLIDHVIVFAKAGFDRTVQGRLDCLRSLWIEHGAPDEEGERGRKEWRLALEGFGTREDFESDSALLKSSTVWESATPYLRPWHGPRGFEETETQIRRELSKRLLRDGRAVRIEPILNAAGQPCYIPVASDKPPEPVVKFHRVRARRGLDQPDAFGASLRLSFDEPIAGPLALGFGAHFGLGLFRAVG